MKHAVQLGIPVHSATNIMLFLGLTSMISRIIFGRICDSERINRLYINQASVFGVGGLALCLYFLTVIVTVSKAIRHERVNVMAIIITAVLQSNVQGEF